MSREGSSPAGGRCQQTRPPLNVGGDSDLAGRGSGELQQTVGGGDASQNRGRVSLAEETADAKCPTRELAQRVDMVGHRGGSFPRGVSKGQCVQAERGVQVW